MEIADRAGLTDLLPEYYARLPVDFSGRSTGHSAMGAIIFILVPTSWALACCYTPGDVPWKA